MKRHTMRHFIWIKVCIYESLCILMDYSIQIVTKLDIPLYTVSRSQTGILKLKCVSRPEDFFCNLATIAD